MSTAQKANNKNKYFMIFICMLIQAIPFGVAQNIQPLFIPYVINKFSFSLASFSLIFTFGAIASAIFSPFLGKLFGKVNIKVLFIIGTLLSSLGFLGFGFANNLPMFYILSGVSQIGCVLFSGLGVPYVINNWFPKKGRGKALGLAFAGGSIGNIFLQQLTSQLLASKGPSFSYIFFGLLATVVSLPVILLFIRMPKPEEVDYTEDPVESKVPRIHERSTFEGLGVKGTITKPAFWIFCVGFALMAISISALSTQYATYFTNDLKMSATLIGTLGSVFAAFCLIGNIGGGALFDKIGTKKTMTISLILAVSAILSLLLSHKIHSIAFVFSIAYGLNVFSYMSAPAFMATDVFGKKDSSVILGVISLMFAVGFAFGSSLFGAVADNFGFQAAWLTMLACSLIGHLLLLAGIVIFKKQNH